MMLVEHILEGTRKRLATLTRDSRVTSAAEILINADTPLAVVCDSEGIAVGVISRTDLVKVLAAARVDACNMSAETIMSPCLFSCQPHQSLQEVWESMNTQSLRCVPVLDDEGRPQGVLHARDLAKALLEEVSNEEGLLRDYVMGVGYQ